ncbi:MAG: 4Fe-4S binding protein [Bacillota bacterium]
MSAFVIDNLCRGCQRCVDACPNRAISVFARLAVVNADKCVECEECMQVCMHGAITFRSENLNQLTNQLQEIEAKLADLKARKPAHSTKPEFFAQLEELEEQRDKLKLQIEKL